MAVDIDKLREVDEFDDTEPSSVTLKKAVSFVENKSFPTPKHWTAEQLDELEYPNDLTLLNDDELGKQMGIWTSVIAYTQYQVAMADVENTAKRNKMTYETNKEYLSLLGDKMKEGERKAHLKTESNLVKLQGESDLANAKYVLLDSLLKAYSGYYKSFSRELSRRQGDGSERPPRAQNDYDEEDFSAGKEKGKSLWNRMEDRDE